MQDSNVTNSILKWYLSHLECSNNSGQHRKAPIIHKACVLLFGIAWTKNLLFYNLPSYLKCGFSRIIIRLPIAINCIPFTFFSVYAYLFYLWKCVCVHDKKCKALWLHVSMHFNKGKNERCIHTYMYMYLIYRILSQKTL